MEESALTVSEFLILKLHRLTFKRKCSINSSSRLCGSTVQVCPADCHVGWPPYLISAMGQEVANSVTVTEGSPDLEAPVCRKYPLQQVRPLHVQAARWNLVFEYRSVATDRCMTLGYR